ncbi:uncharacterized protein BX664DRAFT_334882 [Halteromyces radiatus]|uniref:uncharacterized protein n=1 Tax=Halteromyces radiatus TaxID=101107 RepID=UPI00221E76FC|nr:uncharacterized protein BX664DRAFT_334882 [Halteromyces radiatus]KAI8086090.1 hypothetical protein BX664DRAFT_334882 [Halteromyces radiatus]
MINLEEYFKDLGLGIQGRTMVALKPFPAGSVLWEQAPLTQVPLPSVRRQRCNYCLRRASLQCCGRCRSAYFCSNTCFRNAWLHYHHVLCEPLEYDTYTNVDADRWLLERAALTLHSHARLNKHNSHSPPHLKYAIQALELHPPPPPGLSATHHATTTTTNGNHISTIRLPSTTPGAITTSSPSVPIDYNAVSEMMAPFDCPFTPAELSSVQEQITLSRFDILDPEQHMDKVGYGVYPLTTLYVQHSCRPNTGVVYRQDKQRLVTLDDISPGDLITISYVDLTLPRQARMDDLQLRFGPEFDCTCSRCQNEFSCLDTLLERGEIGQPGYLRLDQASTVLEEDIKEWNILDSIKQSIGKDFDGTLAPETRLHPSEFSHYVCQAIAPEIYSEGTDAVVSRHLGVNTLETFSAFAKDSRKEFTKGIIPVIHSLSNCDTVPAFTVNMVRAAEVALRQYMDQQKWLEAAKCATYLFVVYRLVYPPLHPVCSFHAIILARTCWNSLVQLELAGIGNKLEKIYMHGIRTWIDIARDSVLLSFGQESSLWREIVDLQWVFERDQKLR